MPDSGESGRAVKIALVAVPLAVILVPVFLSTVGAVLGAGEDYEEFLEIPADQESCVRETAWMRYHHMELLKEKRDEVLREGKRGDVSLLRCRECHTSRERFCNKCHEAVNLEPDCFGCHYYP